MLIPQFTLRWLLGMTAVMAVVFLVMTWAMRGSAWAIGVSTVILTLTLAGLVYAGLFAIIWLVSLLGPANSRTSRDSSSKGAR